MRLTQQTAEYEINSIMDRLGYRVKRKYNRIIDIIHNNIEDENVQFFIAIMHECMNDDDGLKGYQ